MGILQDRLAQWKGKELVVVLTDSHSYRGVLVDFDTETLILKDVTEGGSANAHGWEEPTVSTGITRKLVTVQGVFSNEDKDAEIVRFKDVLIRIPHVIRVYEWSPQNLAKPQYLQVEKSKVRPGAPRAASTPGDF